MIWSVLALAGAVELSAQSDLVADVATDILVTGVAPGAPVVLAVGRGGEGAGDCPSWGHGACLDMLPPATRVGAGGTADVRGEVAFALASSLPVGTYHLQAVVTDGSGEVSNVHTFHVRATQDDPDGDGLINLIEHHLGTSMVLRDTDGDGVQDAADVLPRVANTADVYIDDIVVSDPTSPLPDPEFDDVGLRATWQTFDGSEVWVADLDPITGALVPLDGKGALVDTDVLPISEVLNGPEWMQTDTGGVVLYGKRVNGVDMVYRGDEVGGAWVPSAVIDGRAPFGTLDPADPTPWLYTFRRIAGEPRSFLHPVGMVASEVEIPGPLIWGRWEAGTDTLLGLVDVNGVFEVHEVGADGIPTQRMSLALDKRNVFGWEAPEFGGDRVFFVSVGGLGTREARAAFIYRYRGGRWIRSAVLRPPPRYPFVVSPQPFVHAGHSYVVIRASTTPLNRQRGDSQIWLLGIDEANPFARRISGNTVMERRDPEGVSSPNGAWVYYTERRGSVNVIRRCDAGL